MSSEIIKDTDVGKDCINPYHNPPTMIVIPYGHKLVHTCPACGRQ